MADTKFLDLAGLRQVLSNMKTIFPQLAKANEFKEAITAPGFKLKTQPSDALTQVWNIAGTYTNLNDYALKTYVDKAVSAVQSQALVFKGTVGTTALPTDPKIGDTYVVDKAGTYAGEVCEVGDTLICKAAKTTSKAATWLVVQKNIDGAVTSTETLTAGQIMIGNDNKTIKPFSKGTNGQILKTGLNGNLLWSDHANVWIRPHNGSDQEMPLAYSHTTFDSSGKAVERKGDIYVTNKTVRVNPKTGILYANDFQGTINGHTVKSDVPTNAKFTDTVYSHPSTHPASMITGLATVATTGAYTDLKNAPNIPAWALKATPPVLKLLFAGNTKSYSPLSAYNVEFTVPNFKGIIIVDYVAHGPVATSANYSPEETTCDTVVFDTAYGAVFPGEVKSSYGYKYTCYSWSESSKLSVYNYGDKREVIHTSIDNTHGGIQTVYWGVKVNKATLVYSKETGQLYAAYKDNFMQLSVSTDSINMKAITSAEIDQLFA